MGSSVILLFLLFRSSIHVQLGYLAYSYIYPHYPGGAVLDSIPTPGSLWPSIYQNVSRTRTSLKPVQGVHDVLRRSHPRTPCGYVTTVHESKKYHRGYSSIHPSIHSYAILPCSCAELLNSMLLICSGSASRRFAAAHFLKTTRECDEPRPPSGGEAKTKPRYRGWSKEGLQAPLKPVRDPGRDSRSTRSPSPS